MFSGGKKLKKPKVAFIHPAVGKSLGGSQIFVLELAERLKDRCDITILSASMENELCKPVFSISRGNKADQEQIAYKLMYKTLKKFASTPDIVIEHLSSFFPVLSNLVFRHYDVLFPSNDWGGLLVASIVRKMKGIPVLFTEHNGFMENGKIAARNLKFNPDKYITLSEDFKLWVKKHYPYINVEYIPNGVNFDKFNPNVPPKNLDLPRPIILVVGRYQANKRLELAIDAVSRLTRGSLLMLSSGNNLEILNQKGKSILGDRFRLMKVPHEEIASYYRACDVFTLPSIYEPFGLVYLEAMACNKPVVAPNDLSRMNIIGKAGILCNVTDIDEYAKAIEAGVNTDFELIPYNQAKKYTWEICADRYYEVIKSLVYKNNFSYG